MSFHVLVVDDNEMNLTLVSKILELEGYNVSIAEYARDAIKTVINDPPDLALLDVMMPEINGYELCRKLRQPPINSAMPIIMLTAMNSDMEKQMALEAGANDIWSKPFDMDTFRRHIAELLQAVREPGLG
jgi:CheY-like chemotaxis protein